MRVTSVCLYACTLFSTAAAHGATFTVIGTIDGGPQIGAINGDTLYGTIPYSGDGVLFSYTLSGTYKVLHNFSSGSDGSQPNGRLAVDSSGNIFGTAPGGGTYGGGTIFEYSKSGNFSVPHAFGYNGDGTAPMQGPTLGLNNVIYGTTGEGAIGGSGNIWQLANGNYKVLYEFMSQGDGHCPFSGLSVGKNGTMYGTTVGVGFGGNPNGSVWSFSTKDVLKTLYVFQDGNDGEWPDQSPVVDKQGNLFGTTHIQNGNSFDGAIWTIDRAGKFSILHELNGATDGSQPNSPLLIGTDGELYGTTVSGGPGGAGTIFTIKKTGKFAVVHGFTGGDDGGQPTGNLVRGPHGVIYGGTEDGPVFSVTP